MPRLLAREGDRADRRCRTHAGAAVSHHAARHVDGDQRQPALRSRSQCCRDRALQGPTQAGSKQCIDDQRGALDHPRLQCLDAAVPAVGVQPRIAPQIFPGPPQGDANRPAELCECDSRGETVAAIVAGAAQHADGPGRPAAGDLEHHGMGGILHQHRAGGAAGNRRAIRLRHLRDTEQRRLIGGRGARQTPAPCGFSRPTTNLPKLRPDSNPRKACGAFSRPCTRSSRYLMRP